MLPLKFIAFLSLIAILLGLGIFLVIMGLAADFLMYILLGFTAMFVILGVGTFLSGYSYY